VITSNRRDTISLGDLSSDHLTKVSSTYVGQTSNEWLLGLEADGKDANHAELLIPQVASTRK
jgi:hypothetical protein